MSDKTKRILSYVVMALPVLMVIFSGILKVTQNPELVSGMTQKGYGSYITIFGIAEILFAILFLIPKTYKIGFYLLIAYLGGAAAVEVSAGTAPVAFVLIALTWIGVYLRDKTMFLPARS